jgi:hypothetical protein
MSLDVEIEGDSAEAVALALLKLVAKAEGKLDSEGEPQGVDREWLLDTYAECLDTVLGARPVGFEEDEEDIEDDDAADFDDDEEEAMDELETAPESPAKP